MARISDTSFDMGFTGDGDFRIVHPEHMEIGIPGDIEPVSMTRLEILQQIILNRFMTNPGEYTFNRMVGVGFSQFLGMPNNAETGASIKTAIVNELTRDNLILSRDLDVKVFPMDRHSIGIVVTVINLPSSLAQSGFTMGFTYDMRYNQVVPRHASEFIPRSS